MTRAERECIVLVDGITVVASAVASRHDVVDGQIFSIGVCLSARMNPHRQRKLRKDGAALRYLDEWRMRVEDTERLARRGGYVADRPDDCPCCDPVRPGGAGDARARLEGLMRNGGRRAHRLRAAVTKLDERYRAAAAESGHAWRSAPWWERRKPLDQYAPPGDLPRRV